MANVIASMPVVAPVASVSRQPAARVAGTRVGFSASRLVANKVNAKTVSAKRFAKNVQLITRCDAKAEVTDAAGEAIECQGIYCLMYDMDEETAKSTMKPMITVAVSGAAGQISNHLLFKIASGEVFGKDQPIALNMLGSERSREALEGVAMELEDSLFPLLRQVNIGIDPMSVFKDADWALLIGAKPRGPGMERGDLLEMNGQIFVGQGQALDKVAKKTCKVVVVGNPCNTNALICMENAPSIPKENFHALTRLDENRAKGQLAMKAGVFYDKVTNMTIWGNHSTTQVPDFVNAKIEGKPAPEVIGDQKWLEEEFTPLVQTRGGALIKKWGRSSAASTAVSIADEIRSIAFPTPAGDWYSSAVISDGNPYGVQEGIVYSFPIRTLEDGSWEFAEDVIINDWLREKIKASEAELANEKNCVSHLIGGPSKLQKFIMGQTVGEKVERVGWGVWASIMIYRVICVPALANRVPPAQPAPVATVEVVEAKAEAEVPVVVPAAAAAVEEVAEEVEEEMVEAEDEAVEEVPKKKGLVRRIVGLGVF